MKKEKSIIVKSYLTFVFILTALAVTVFIYVPGIVKIPVSEVEENKSEIVVEELEDGSKLVRNMKEGISVVAPEGWKIETFKNQSGLFSLYSPELVEVEGQEMFMCKISFLIDNEKTTISELQNEINLTNPDIDNIDYTGFELIEISGAEALRDAAYIFNKVGYVDSVSIPRKEKLYIFRMYANSSDKEKCTEYFNEFLDDVVINLN